MATLDYSPEANEQLSQIENSPALAKRWKAVRKALGLIEINTRHPSLNTHVYKGAKCPHGDKLFEAYAENQTPGAYRIFFCYLREPQGVIYIVSVVPHP